MSDNLPALPKSLTPSLELSLSDKLSALLDSRDSPVVGPKTADELRQVATIPEPDLATRDQIEVMIARLSLGTAKAQASRAEANERLDLYCLALRDIPICDLRWAFAELVKTATFLPMPAEVRTVALRPSARRKYLQSRARHLVWKHETFWHPPVEQASPEDVQAILADMVVGGEPVTAPEAQ